MSRQDYHSILCDDCGVESDFRPTVKEARQTAKAAGWTRHDDIDHCDRCEAKHLREIRDGLR